MTESTTGWVVKVRTRSTASGAGATYTTPSLSRRLAAKVRDEIRESVRNIGDGPAFVVLTDRNGAEVDIRAREVAMVELGPELPPRGRREPGRPAGEEGPGQPPPGGDASGITLVVDGHPVLVAEESTDFLRRRVEAELAATIGRHPAGSRR